MSGPVRTVLVVDSDPATAEVALGVLPASLYRVVGVAEARQAVAILGGERVDVLLSELVLPGESGLHLLVEARRLQPLVPRIAVTAVEEFSAAVAAINEAEVFRLLRKPADPLALRAAIEEALGHADAAQEVRGLREAAEHRRLALVDLESDHPGISFVPSGPDGYFIPPQRLQGVVARLAGSAVGRALGEALAAFRDAKEG
jgi:DNA-binding NtrC family response regulator